jgi:D-arabinose 1-dehydrogenase
LVFKQTSVPLDIIQTYSHQNLQNTALKSFLPLFRSLAKVPKITNASPLNMGLLTTAGSMGWHPASPELKGFMKSLAGRVKERAEEQGLEGVKLEDVAVSFGMRGFGDDAEGLPVVVGCNTLDQVGFV